MRESEFLMEIRAKGAARGAAEARREDILIVLRGRLGQVVPEDVAAAVRGMADPAELSQWFDAALTAASYDDFRGAIRA